MKPLGRLKKHEVHYTTSRTWLQMYRPAHQRCARIRCLVAKMECVVTLMIEQVHLLYNNKTVECQTIITIKKMPNPNRKDQTQDKKVQHPRMTLNNTRVVIQAHLLHRNRRCMMLMQSHHCLHD